MMPAMAGLVVFNQISREPEEEFHRPVLRQNKQCRTFVISCESSAFLL
jgi:hypothetical protein